MSDQINFQGRDFPVLSVVALIVNVSQRKNTLKTLINEQTNEAVVCKVRLDYERGTS